MRHFPEQVREASNNLARFPHIPEAKSFRWSDYTRGMGGAIASSLKGEHLPSGGTTGYLTGILKSLAGAARDAQTPGEMLYGSPVGTFGDNQWTRPDPYELNTKQELWGSYGGMAVGALTARPAIRGRVPGVAGRGSGRTPPAARTPSPVDGEMAGGNRPVALATSKGTADAVSAEHLRAQLIGKEISHGHAFIKHVQQQGEFKGLNIRNRSDFEKHIENVVNNRTSFKELSNGRTAYWHDATGTVVIRNPRASDGGTAFQPTSGRKYFDNLR